MDSTDTEPRESLKKGSGRELWLGVQRQAERFASAAAVIRRVSLRVLLLSAGGWLAGGVMLRDWPGSVYVTLGALSALPLLGLAFCHQALDRAADLPAILRDNEAAVTLLIDKYRPKVETRSGERGWRAWWASIRGGFSVLKALNTIHSTARDGHALIRGLVLPAMPVFWGVFGVLMTTAIIQSVAVVVVLLIRAVVG